MTTSSGRIFFSTILLLLTAFGQASVVAATDPSKQVDLAANASTQEVQLSWTLSNITPMAQEIYRDTDSNPKGRKRIGFTRNGSTFTDSNVTPGTTYFYWIKVTESDWTVTNSTAVSATLSIDTPDPEPVPDPTPIPTPTPDPVGVNVAPLASATTSYVSPWETLSAVNDNSSPANSNDKANGAYGNWHNPNSLQWVQYDWPQNYRLSSTQVYWFDDNGGVLTPTMAYFEYWNGNAWVGAGDIPLAKDAFNNLQLGDVLTNRVRVSMLNTRESTGMLEWRVFGEPSDEVAPTPEPNPDPVSGDCQGPVAGTQGSNPLLPGIYTADPAVLVNDCTFYITAGHDEGATGFYMRNWYVLSSKDLVNWTDNGGPVLSLDVFAWADANAWAGQMVERNGKFYWYVPVNERGKGMAIGVAVADSPLGPFHDAIGGPLVNDDIEMSAFNYAEAYQTVYTIDPGVFVDEDGQAYLVYGSFGRMVTVALGDDMISLKGDLIERAPQGFFEAPYLTKREGVYYLVFAAGVNPATIDYATSNSPLGPWQYRGRILDAMPGLPGEDAPTSHPAIAEFAGQWYLAYHLSNSPGGGTYRRQVALDKLTFNADGSIQKVIPSSGLVFANDGSTNHPPVAQIDAVGSIVSGQTLSLNGSGSSDIDGDTLTYRWSQTQGAQVALGDVSSRTLSFVAPTVSQPTSFSFQLTVDDGSASDSASIQFQVNPLSDTSAPVILSRDPQPGQGAVSVSPIISITFNEPLREDLINDQSVVLMQGGNLLPGAVSYDSGSYTVTLSLSADLMPGTQYAVSLGDTLQDLAGNPVPSDAWNFTTLGGSTGGGVACDFSEPPAEVSAWVDESWNAQLQSNITGREAWLLDNAMMGNGEINLCVRWGASTPMTQTVLDKIAPAMQRWLNEWYTSLGSYGCFPYPNGVQVKIAGVAVKPGQESLLQWNDGSIPVYTQMDADGEPMCPDSCSFFTHWSHEFPGCPGGESNHFDYSLWLNDSIGGGAAAVGGDWGLRMPMDSFVNALDQPSNSVLEHEMGHGFGMQDYYDWTGSRPEGGSVMIVGSHWGDPVLTVGDSWLIRRIWKEQKTMRGW